MMIFLINYYFMELDIVKEKFKSISVDKSLVIKLLLFVSIMKILILNLFPINMIDSSYGKDEIIISLDASDNIDRYKIELLQFPSNNPQQQFPSPSSPSPSGNPQIPQQQFQSEPSSPSPSLNQLIRQQQSPS